MKYLYQNKYWEVNKDYNIDKLLYLMIDKSNIITTLNDYIWRNNKNQWHRDYNLPSNVFIYKEICNLYWNNHNKEHRENNKPLYIGYSGNKEYYKNNIFIKK